MSKSSVPAIANAETKDFKALGNVDLVVYTGQFTRDETAGIDFLVVGDVNHTKLNKFIAELETKEGKEIRYTAMSLAEFKYRKQVNDRFLSNVMDAKKQVIYDRHFILTSKPEKLDSKKVDKE